MGVAALLAAILVSVLGLSVGSAAVVAAPKVTSFSPASGPVGTKVVVTGTAFTAATSVQFAGKEAVYTVNSATQITATVPTGATTGKVRVATTAGAAQSSTSFTVTKSVAPTTTGFSPTSGLVGTKVVITGTGFAGSFECPVWWRGGDLFGRFSDADHGDRPRGCAVREDPDRELRWCGAVVFDVHGDQGGGTDHHRLSPRGWWVRRL